MDLRLNGRRAVVTGSSGGIGEAIARRLAAEGAAVVVHGRRPDATGAVAKAINADDGDAGIRVNTVSPGIITTPGVEAFYRAEATRRGWDQDWPAIEASVLAEILDNPTGRLGRPDEVADLVAFVASPLADYINGANLRIDGGSTAVV
jgi:NAD(P)-dependent dehydrogenase (short-subunit alcohol dehydrogenase family)